MRVMLCCEGREGSAGFIKEVVGNFELGSLQLHLAQQAGCCQVRVTWYIVIVE